MAATKTPSSTSLGAMGVLANSLGVSLEKPTSITIVRLGNRNKKCSGCGHKNKKCTCALKDK